MPATPEVGNGIGLPRRVEVHRDRETEQGRDTYRHIAIAREVAIDLYGVAIETQEHLTAGEERGIVENAIDEVLRDIVGDDTLLRQSDEHEVGAHAKELVADLQRTADLRGKVGGPDDGARQQRGEEGDVEGIVQEALHRLHLAPIDVHDIGDGLEGVETDAHGQENVPRLEIAPDHLRHHSREEIGVFEVAE